MSAEITPNNTKKKWGIGMSESLRTTLTIRILLAYVIFDTISDLL
jgi:hypothetical protein